MQSRKRAVATPKSTPATPEASIQRRRRRLQQELTMHGNYFASQVEPTRRRAEIKRLCAGVLRANGYTAEAREIAAEARWHARSASRCSFLGKDFIKRANSLASPAL
jgi:hypothetical protein